ATGQRSSLADGLGPSNAGVRSQKRRQDSPVPPAAFARHPGSRENGTARREVNEKPLRAGSSNSSEVSSLSESQSLGECTVATVSQRGTEVLRRFFNHWKRPNKSERR